MVMEQISAVVGVHTATQQPMPKQLLILHYNRLTLLGCLNSYAYYIDYCIEKLCDQLSDLIKFCGYTNVLQWSANSVLS